MVYTINILSFADYGYITSGPNPLIKLYKYYAKSSWVIIIVSIWTLRD